MSEIKKVIFDTDLGDDCDDVMALDLILSAHRAGECELIGVTYTGRAKNAPACIYAILKEHGCADIPIGRYTVVESDPIVSDRYATAVANAFRDDDAPTYDRCEDAVSFLRRLLSENDKVDIIATGSMTNLAGLLTSLADEYSPLGGRELVAEKVEQISIMAGNFSHQTGINPDGDHVDPDGSIKAGPEWNVIMDYEASRIVFNALPVQAFFLPYEAGLNMITGSPMVKAGKGNTPDSMAYITHGSPDGRHSWDPATALYGIFGAAPWFYRSAAGRIVLSEDQCTHFITSEGGNCHILECAAPQNEIAAEIDRRVMRLFDK